MGSLTGRVVLMAGGGRGLESVAAALLREGAVLALQAQGEAERKAAARVEAGGAHSGTCRVLDETVTDFADADRVVSALAAAAGRVDVLLTPAPPEEAGHLTDLGPDAWGATVAHLRRVVGLTRAAARHMAGRGAGRVITFSSSSTYESAGAGRAAVNSAVLSLTSAVAASVGGQGVTANCVLLGGEPAGEPAGGPQGVPGAFPGGADALAPLVAHLCDEASAQINGRFLYVSGGDVGLYAMPLIVESAHVLLRFADTVGKDDVGRALAPLLNIGKE